MNKVIVAMLSVIVIIGAIFTAIIITKPDDSESSENTIEKVSDVEILDDCTD